MLRAPRFAIALLLLACAVLVGCEDRRPPVDQAVEWFRHYGQERSARCIAWLESSNNPTTTGSAGERGIFQIHPVHRRDFERYTGQPWQAAYDANWNGYYAVHMWAEQGWRPWSTRHRCGL